MESKGFDPKDLEEISSRKPTKFKMKKADYKELGRNLLLGSVDFAVGSLGAIVVASSTISLLSNRSSSSSSSSSIDELYEENSKDGWQNGTQGYGYYRNDIKDKD